MSNWGADDGYMSWYQHILVSGLQNYRPKKEAALLESEQEVELGMEKGGKSISDLSLYAYLMKGQHFIGRETEATGSDGNLCRREIWTAMAASWFKTIWATGVIITVNKFVLLAG